MVQLGLQKGPTSRASFCPALHVVPFGDVSGPDLGGTGMSRVAGPSAQRFSIVRETEHGAHLEEGMPGCPQTLGSCGRS